MEVVFSIEMILCPTFQIEYIVVAFDDEAKEVKLNMRASDVLVQLARLEEENPYIHTLSSFFPHELATIQI